MRQVQLQALAASWKVADAAYRSQAVAPDTISQSPVPGECAMRCAASDMAEAARRMAAAAGDGDEADNRDWPSTSRTTLTE